MCGLDQVKSRLWFSLVACRVTQVDFPHAGPRMRKGGCETRHEGDNNICGSIYGSLLYVIDPTK